MLHQVTKEKAIYVVKGSAVVDVAGVATEIFAGDVVSLPGGVLRSRPGKAEDTTVVAFTVLDGAPNPKAVVIRGQGRQVRGDQGRRKGRPWQHDGHRAAVSLRRQLDPRREALPARAAPRRWFRAWMP